MMEESKSIRNAMIMMGMMYDDINSVTYSCISVDLVSF